MEYSYYGLFYRGSLHSSWFSLSFVFSLSYLPSGHSSAYPIIWIMKPIKAFNVLNKKWYGYGSNPNLSLQYNRVPFKWVVGYGQDILPFTCHILCEYLYLRWGLLSMCLIHSLDYYIIWVVFFFLLMVY